MDHLHTIKENQKQDTAKAAEKKKRNKENAIHAIMIPPKENDIIVQCARSIKNLYNL